MVHWTRETPWRQGLLLTDEAIGALGLAHPAFPKCTVAIVASHDCDLVQVVDKEPKVEVVVGRRIDRSDGNYTHAKNSRTLHIDIEGHEPIVAEFVATDKQSLQKSLLVDFVPAAGRRLSPASKATIQRWLASRYSRAGFPDEFQRRLVVETKLADRIAKAVKPHGKLITAVLFDVDDGEDQSRAGPDDVYILDITLLHSVEPDQNAAELAADTAVQFIREAFEKKLLDATSGRWQQIELRYCDVMSEEALSYRQFTLMRRWRFDYISLAAEPQQTMAAE